MHTRSKYDFMLYKVIRQVRSPPFFSFSDEFIQILVLKFLNIPKDHIFKFLNSFIF